MASHTSPFPFRQSDVVVLVSGLVGSGRSTFINALLPESSRKMLVGETLDTCTTEIDYSIMDLKDFPKCKKDYRLILVDTPGFDDPGKTDLSVLKQIADWLYASFSNLHCRGGVVYLHDVSVDRYHAVAQSNLGGLDSSSDSKLYRRLIIATTKWNRLPSEEWERRRSNLMERWGNLRSAGSKVYDFKEPDDAWKIVSQFLPDLEGSEVNIGAEVARMRGHNKQHSDSSRGEAGLYKVLRMGRMFGILGALSRRLSR